MIERRPENTLPRALVTHGKQRGWKTGACNGLKMNGLFRLFSLWSALWESREARCGGRVRSTLRGAVWRGWRARRGREAGPEMKGSAGRVREGHWLRANMRNSTILVTSCQYLLCLLDVQFERGLRIRTRAAEVVRLQGVGEGVNCLLRLWKSVELSERGWDLPCVSRDVQSSLPDRRARCVSL